MAKVMTLVNGRLIEVKKEVPVVHIGDGVTVSCGTDSSPYTVIDVSKNGKKIKIQADNAVRIDNNGMSESQEYEYTPNLNGYIEEVSFRPKDGSFRIVGTSSSVRFGFRRKYYDYCF